MKLKEAIDEVLEGLPEERQREVLDFARFVSQAGDADEWRGVGQSGLARAYGPSEPEYSEADIKSGDD